MNEFLKDPKDHKESSQHACLCMGVSYRYMSVVIAAGFFFMIVAFMGGYFLGKQHMLEHFVTKIEQDSFADQIYSSLCALYDQDDEVNIEDINLDESHEMIAFDDISGEDSSSNQHDISHSEVMKEDDLDEIKELPSVKKYYAQLIGFGTQSAAEQFVEKQARKKRSLVIQPRESSTARGKKSSWYQVVTESFTNRDELADLVDRITKEENIKGAQILSLNAC